MLQCGVCRYLAPQVRGPPFGLTLNQSGFYPHICLSSRHSVAGWYLPDLCLLRHAALPLGFPFRISRTMTGCWNTCLVLAKVQLSNGLYGRTQHFAEAFYVAAFVDFGIRGSMCHAQRVLIEKAIYVNLSGSAWISYRHSHVIYRAALAIVHGWFCGAGRPSADWAKNKQGLPHVRGSPCC